MLYFDKLHKPKVYRIGLAKWDLWGLEAESWFVVASYAFAKTVFANPNIAHNMTYIKLLCREHQIARSSR